MEYATNDGVSLYYERRGPTDAETVVFVEGLGYGRWMWRWQRDPLSETYDTIVVDNRGTGDSDAPPGPYSIETMAADLDAVLADAGVESAHVVGASMGGMIAQQYALDYDRATSLALFCTSFGGEDAVPTPPETQARMFDVPEGLDEREAIRYKMEPALTEEFVASNDDLLDRIVEWRLESDADEAARDAQATAVATFDVADRLDELTLPTLVLHGTADRVLPIENGERLAARLPNATFERVTGGSHLFFVEQADDVTDRLREFVDGR
ncbi:Pimeloyl-ACP methyl ester carboxylesterase [Halogranum amylolyticum]|uniref:Pimeloyl-ACP methyl ester carboxylesterase n=1 Tax=Halogranum amylolyticum TaxID=660520 RepID=A0A1H8TCZ7_9EURY|nr:alpha/beta hydrolase [Halogranum amylolyticum]SEO88616.1 Pimeloyl-ACP methyl ester carboxylesterase [Halogranum amylolyticum]